MPASNVETMTTPRDSLPNSYVNVTAREIDFVTRFAQNWTALQNILGIMRPIRKTTGTKLVTYTTSCALESGAVPAGAVIPYSKTTITQTGFEDLTIDKYAKAVTIEDVQKYGAAVAVEKSDDAFLTELQNKVLGDFYTYLNGATGVQTDTATTWQMALAKAQGLVLNKFATLSKEVTGIVGFANILDAYDYLGNANITVQTAFGLNYIENFMGYNRIFLCDSNKIPSGKFVAIPVENLVAYYINPSTSDFAMAGLEFTVDGETPLVGFHTEGNYSTLVSENTAIMGVYLFAEYLDGIAVVTIG